MEEVAANTVVEQAYAWLCRCRKKKSHNADIWDFRWRWCKEKCKIQTALLQGDYRFSALDWFITEDGERVELYNSRDALVIKALSIVLTEKLLPELSKNCYHLKGHGGVQEALRKVKNELPQARFICRSDVRGYYANINHRILEDHLNAFIQDERVMNLLRQYLKRSVCRGENYWDINHGIPLRSPLSPLMGALYLLPLDQAMLRHQVVYICDIWMTGSYLLKQGGG